jgi:hypothetical protein
MKKTAAVLACMLLAAHGFAQEDYSRQISECVAALGKAVPDGYTRTDRTHYKKIGENVFLTIGEDKKVVGSGFGAAFDRTNKAVEWNGQLYTLFEKENWQYYDTKEYGDIYKKGDIYAVITESSKRDDGLIATHIAFTRDPSAL